MATPPGKIIRHPNGQTTHYIEDDFTDPWLPKETILIQHGFARHAAFWYHWVPILGRRYRIIRRDARGHGYSSAPSRDSSYSYSIDTICDEIIDTLDQIKVDKVHFLGESTSGMIGEILAQSTRTDYIHSSSAHHLLICHRQPYRCLPLASKAGPQLVVSWDPEAGERLCARCPALSLSLTRIMCSGGSIRSQSPLEKDSRVMRSFCQRWMLEHILNPSEFRCSFSPLRTVSRPRWRSSNRSRVRYLGPYLRLYTAAGMKFTWRSLRRVRMRFSSS
jgi:pimeloyl-ACP methyl ester carboxylesterase